MGHDPVGFVTNVPFARARGLVLPSFFIGTFREIKTPRLKGTFVTANPNAPQWVPVDSQWVSDTTDTMNKLHALVYNPLGIRPGQNRTTLE